MNFLLLKFLTKFNCFELVYQILHYQGNLQRLLCDQSYNIVTRNGFSCDNGYNYFKYESNTYQWKYCLVGLHIWTYSSLECLLCFNHNTTHSLRDYFGYEKLNQLLPSAWLLYTVHQFPNAMASLYEIGIFLCFDSGFLPLCVPLAFNDTHREKLNSIQAFVKIKFCL